VSTSQSTPPWLVSAFYPDLKWAAKRCEDPLEPELEIIDSHHHLYDRAGHRYLLPELLADIARGHNVVATIYVEWVSMCRSDGPPELRIVGETEFANGVAAMSASGGYGKTRACAGIVGFAELRLGDRVQPVLEAHLRVAGSRFKGVRYTAGWDADPTVGNSYTNPPKGLLQDPTFRAGFARLAPLGLSFDTIVYHPQLGEVADLAGAYPDTTIILNHVGAPIGTGSYRGQEKQTFDHWRAGIVALAGYSNVVVKLGGLGMSRCPFDFHGRDMPASSAELADAWKPYLETCIQAFGPQRCMFESNFPVDGVTAGYVVLWNAFKRHAAGYSAEEKAALFSGTARRVYRLA
jgi:L-fuconolactonase